MISFFLFRFPLLDSIRVDNRNREDGKEGGSG